MKLIRTQPSQKDFQALIQTLDHELALINGEEDDFFRTLNGTESINHALVVYEQKEAVGCGCFKKLDATKVEIKRMFVKPKARGKGISKKILAELEHWASELGFEKATLETSVELVPAIKLYEGAGYLKIPNYSPYENVATSRCFEKII